MVEKMIRIPEWLFTLLTLLSGILLFIVVLFAITIIKNYIRRRRYRKLKPKGKHLPRPKFAFNEGHHDSNPAAIPRTYPTIMQSGCNLRNLTWREKMDLFSLSATPSSHYAKGLPAFTDHRSLLSQYASQTLEDPYQWRAPKSRMGLGIRRVSSTQLEATSREEKQSKNSSLRSLSEGVNKNENDSSVFASEIHRVYSHSELLPDADDVVGIDSTDNAVISYDQENVVIKESACSGSLSFILDYDSMVPMLSIYVKCGLDLQPVSSDLDSPLNTYVNLCLVPEDFLWQRTDVVKNDRYPVYNETFQIPDVLYHKLREYSLCFYVMECSDVRGERVIGKLLYPLSDLRAQDRVEVCKELSPL